MAWVVSKIIGDGLSTETAFRTAAQDYGIPILNADHIPVDPKTGIPLADFALLEIPDAEVAKLSKEQGAFVVPDKATSLDKADLQAKLEAQGCVADLSSATKGSELLTILKVEAAPVKSIEVGTK